MSSPRITVTQEYPDGRVTKWTGTGEVEYSVDPALLLVISSDLRRVGLVAPWFDLDVPRDGAPARWVESGGAP